MTFETKLTLRVYSKKLTLKEIRAILGEPSDCCSIGDVYSKKGKKREHTYWGLESKLPVREPPLLHIIEMLKFIEKNEHHIHELQKKECEIDLCCFLQSDNGQGSFNLPANIMQALAEQALQITFDCYLG